MQVAVVSSSLYIKSIFIFELIGNLVAKTFISKLHLLLFELNCNFPAFKTFNSAEFIIDSSLILLDQVILEYNNLFLFNEIRELDLISLSGLHNNIILSSKSSYSSIVQKANSPVIPSYLISILNIEPLGISILLFFFVLILKDQFLFSLSYCKS